ncbi:MAG: SLBB domain-containing protein [bacterium]
MNKCMKCLILISIMAFIPVFSFALTDSQLNIIRESSIIEEAMDDPTLIQEYMSKQIKEDGKLIDDKNNIIQKKDMKEHLEKEKKDEKEDDEALSDKDKEKKGKKKKVEDAIDLTPKPFNKILQRDINYTSYKLSVGDEIKLEIFNINSTDPEISYNLRISSPDVIILPKLGSIPYKGKSVLEFNKELNKLLIKDNKLATVAIVNPATIEIGVFGFVKVPNYYKIPKNFNIFDVISLAQGPIKMESVDRINLFREGILFKSFGLGELLSQNSLTFSLHNGDIIRIEKQPEVRESDLKAECVYENFDKLKLFGHEIFNIDYIEMIPDQNVEVDENYILGPGDTIEVYIWGRMNERMSLTVSSDGSIFIESFGKILVGGKTYSDVKKMIKGMIKGMEGVEGDAILKNIRTIRIMLLGEVQNPGFQSISSLSNVTTAIVKAGGITNLANIREVKIKRADKVISEIDYYDFIFKGNTAEDIRLQAGDVIFVPRTERRIYIAGKVKKPAIYELKGRESLQDVIRFAGGLMPSAYGKNILIQRYSKNNVAESFSLSISDDFTKFKLKDGDRIAVMNIQTPEVDVVYLFGNVYFPGKYSLKKNTRLLDVIGGSFNLKPDTLMDYGYIKRFFGEGKKRKVLSFSLEEALNNPDHESNIVLEALDEIYVLGKTNQSVAEIRGEVYNPGRYIVEDEVTLFDLINKAGGLTTDASKTYIEIIRKKEEEFITRFLDIEKSKRFMIEADDKVIVHSRWDYNLKEYVTITGEINKPGKYLLTKNLTIKDLVLKAGGVTKDAYRKVAHIYRLKEDSFSYALLTINIEEAMASKKGENIILHDRDELVIHSVWEFKPRQIVSITGEVNNPGEYPYAEGMKLYDLIVAAGNVKEEAYLDHTEIVRMSVKNGKTSYEVIDVNLNEMLKHNISFELKPYDVFNVKRIREFRKEEKVVINGEILFPGIYIITEGEKLSDLLKRAGGITENAFLEGIVFRRESAKTLQEENLKNLRQRLQSILQSVTSEEVSKAVSSEDIMAQSTLQSTLQQVLSTIEGIKAEGRVVLKIKTMKGLEGSKYDFILEDGDEVVIPKRPSTVTVVGEVYNTTSFIFDGINNEVGYYLDACGGLNEVASEEDIYLVLADGSIVSNKYIKANYWWKDIRSVHIGVGDTIVVPRRLKFPSYMRDIKDITQILYQIATTVAVTRALF